MLLLQGDSGGEVSILGGDSSSNCEKKKKVHINMCLILNGYWDSCVNQQIQKHF
jgi:hypothetical protein